MYRIKARSSTLERAVALRLPSINFKYLRLFYFFLSFFNFQVYAADGCSGSGFVFKLSPKECELVQFNGVGVAVLGFNLSTLEVEAPGPIRADHSILYLRHLNHSTSRAIDQLKSAVSHQVRPSVKTYSSEEGLVTEFIARDGEPVRILRQSLTSEGNRIINKNTRVLFRIDNGTSDLVEVDGKISSFLNKIIVQ